MLTPLLNSAEEPMSSFSRSRLLRREASRERPLSALGGGVRLKSEPVSGAPSGVVGAETGFVGRRMGDWSALERLAKYGCRHTRAAIKVRSHAHQAGVWMHTSLVARGHITDPPCN